jgi:glycolate oxidase iron-sulfur subunit
MFIDEVKDCSKCGKCRSVCPVFLEVMSPRGRVSLVEAMLDGGLSNSERYVDTIRSCIKCMRCSEACPVGIRVERVIQSARELLAQKLGISEPASEVFNSLLLSPSAFRSALVNAGKASANPDAGDKSALAPLWQLPLFFHEGARLPELAADTVLGKYPEYIDAGGKKRIALFVGCSVNYVHTEIADSAIEVLKRFNVDIFLPKDQLCCGTPVLLFGDVDGVRELAKRNIAALKADEFDAVVARPAG